MLLRGGLRAIHELLLRRLRYAACDRYLRYVHPKLINIGLVFMPILF